MKIREGEALLPELFAQAEPSSFCATQMTDLVVYGAITCMSQTSEVSISQSDTLCSPSYWKPQGSFSDLFYM